MKCRVTSRTARSLTLGLFFLAATTITAQQLSSAKNDDDATAKLVCEMMSRFHIHQVKIDDKISSEFLDTFIKQLDPQKQYFIKSDIELFEKHRTVLDDMLKVGNVKFCYDVWDRFLHRLEERIELAQQLIDQPQDFTTDESLVIDSKELDWPATPEDVRERWRLRIKYDLLNLKLEKVTDEEARKRLHTRYRMLSQTMKQTEDFEKLEMYLNAMAHCFDPHSSYMSPQTLEDFKISMNLQLDGIGAALRSEDGMTIVADIVPGGAAAGDGRLQVGDKIVAVGQAEGELIDIVEMKLSKVVRLIRGERGTKVRLQVKKADDSAVVDYELTRQKIELKSSEVKGEVIDTSERVPGSQARIGIIHIPSFYRDFDGAQQGLDDFKSTRRDVQKVLDDFSTQNIDAVVVDLRTNGGGALSEAIEVSGLFLKEGPVVQVKEQTGKIKSHDDVDPNISYKGPLIVLCNRLSASASEIFAGAIKDYDRGIIVGDQTTHGKGTVQNVMPVTKSFQFLSSPDRGALKLTINQFYRVNGDSTQNLGVKSDVVLPSLIDHMDLGESFLDNALAFDRIAPAKHDQLKLRSGELVAKLATESQKRIAGNEEFQKLQKDIEKYLTRKNRKSITLNEAVLRQERDSDKTEDEKTLEEEEEKLTKDGPIFPKGHYNDEVLNISVDYISLLKGLDTAAK
ncbi:MAG: carboxy terminal-processing peptidase [Planctomycetaceae bacterium]